MGEDCYLAERPTGSGYNRISANSPPRLLVKVTVIGCLRFGGSGSEYASHLSGAPIVVRQHLKAEGAGANIPVESKLPAKHRNFLVLTFSSANILIELGNDLPPIFALVPKCNLIFN